MDGPPDTSVINHIDDVRELVHHDVGRSHVNKLQTVEKWMQDRWTSSKEFEVNAPEFDVAAYDGKGSVWTGDCPLPSKFFVTFPYAYMNGKLHLGHAYTSSRADFAARFERMLGKTVLFPFAFHCTGMPIMAAANRLRDELAGTFEQNARSQSQVMLDMGVEPERIPSFVDGRTWMRYFPEHARADVERLGLGIDWRRSFITTDLNPFYDSFVRWQMNKLRSAGKIRYDKRFVVYSRVDEQPCLDHDRRSGEGIGFVQFKAMRAVLTSELRDFENVTLVVCAVNEFEFPCEVVVDPEKQYECARMANGELLLAQTHALENMVFQDLGESFGQRTTMFHVKGSDLENLRVFVQTNVGAKALPISCGTAGASGFEFRTSQRPRIARKNTPRFPANHTKVDGNLQSEVAEMCFERTVSEERMLETEGHLPGFVGETLIESDDDSDESDDEAGSHVRFTGVPSKVVLDESKMFQYAEPEARIVSRSGDVCVVALLNQWAIDYGEPKWRQAVEEHVETMLLDDVSRGLLRATLDWLGPWACSRTFGYGTKLPWDESWVIESLSDSTLYMAYYTVCHMLQGGMLDGLNPSERFPGHAAPRSVPCMNDAAWDYLFFGGAVPKCGVEEKELKRMRAELLYFYPLDLRVSGKDLLPNHLTFMLYSHQAVVLPEQMPRSFAANGHMMLNGDKMSKSTGNFMTIGDAIEKFGADASRIAMADAGDSLDDANFTTQNAESAAARLCSMAKQIGDFWAELPEEEKTRVISSEIAALSVPVFDGLAVPSLTDNDVSQAVMVQIADFHAALFDAEITSAANAARRGYASGTYREALKAALFQIQTARDVYRDFCRLAHQTVNQRVFMRYAVVQTLILSPIAPHICDFIWSYVFKMRQSVVRSTFPAQQPESETTGATNEFMREFWHDANATFAKSKFAKQKSDKLALYVFVARKKAHWQEIAVAHILADHRGGVAEPSVKEIVSRVNDDDQVPLSVKKKIGPYVAARIEDLKKGGPAALEGRTAVDEITLVRALGPSLKAQFGLAAVRVTYADEIGEGFPHPAESRIDTVAPREPIIMFADLI